MPPLIKVYVDGSDGSDCLALPPGVDRASAMEALRERLDATDPRDFAAVVEQWAALRGATWRGGL